MVSLPSKLVAETWTERVPVKLLPSMLTAWVMDAPEALTISMSPRTPSLLASARLFMTLPSVMVVSPVSAFTAITSMFLTRWKVRKL